VDLYSAFIVVPHTQGAQVRSHSVTCKLHRTCLYLKGKKVKEVDLYSVFIVVPHTQGAQVRITQCYRYLQITPYLPLPRKRSPDGASPDWGRRHLIAAYYSFIYPQKDERLSRPGWLTYSGRFTHISLTRQPQVERRTAKVHLSEIDVLPLCHATNLTG